MKKESLYLISESDYSDSFRIDSSPATTSSRLKANSVNEDIFTVTFEDWQYDNDSRQQVAEFQYQFTNIPEIFSSINASQTSGGQDNWLQSNDPSFLAYAMGVLLPQGTEIVDFEFDLGKRISLGQVALPLMPEIKPIAAEGLNVGDNSSALAKTIVPQADVTYRSHDMAGYNTALLNVSPFAYEGDELYFHPAISIKLKVSDREDGPSPFLRNSEDDKTRVANFVVNPGGIQRYSSQAADSQPLDGTLPFDGSYEYVIVTSSSLVDEFQPLITHKMSKGLTAAIVTMEDIYNRFDGNENGDQADRLRDFVQSAVADWGTQYLLLGGDIEHVPYRSVYAPGSGPDGHIPTDMYFACIDGSWNGDGDALWGESNDGNWGGDIDLMPDLAVGRAPVSTGQEAINFVNKVIHYETIAHPNALQALFVGEQLDASTWASNYKETIWNSEFPTDSWTVTELYERDGWWSGSDLIRELNKSPHIVNHFGHANPTYNAKLVNSDVDALTNDFTYFMYSMGCCSGAFDNSDAIAEHHLFTENGAVGAVMNSRYGWYYIGGSMGLSSLYDQEYWDAVFDENILSMGDANNDSKIDNLRYVGSDGHYRWLHQGITLFGDPQTEFYLPPPPPAEIHGSKWLDLDGNGVRDSREPGLAGWTIYLDENQNNRLDQGELSTMTDADGCYAFKNLASGTYRVAEVLQPGWQQTRPMRTTYDWTDSSHGGVEFDWVDISTSGYSIYLDDDSYAVVPLPFSFSFYDESFDSLNISSNGFLTFGDEASQFSNDSIPDGSSPNNIIAPFWDDLNPAERGQILYHSDLANRRFIVQYEEVPHYYDDGAYTFQVILNEDGSILYQYKDLNGIVDSATIGIENADGSDGVQIAFNESYARNNLAVLLDPIAVPTLHTVSVSAGEVLTGLDFGNYRPLLEITGTKRKDRLNGTSADELIDGRRGNDIISSNGGNDVLLGSYGNDRIMGSSDVDYIDGGSGNDRLYGNGGTDTLLGGPGNDIIYGGPDADKIFAGGGNDVIYANGGGDLIDSGTGEDTIWLGGAATIILDKGKGSDTIKNFQLGSTSLQVSDINALSFKDSGRGVRISQSGDLLAVVSGQSASLFEDHLNDIFVV
jgi:Ca2+-binding RTX toxin-like protein